ncbi:MAG: hypothetical protein AAGG01_10645, partial [Planctomycetota bacterium]
MPLVIDIDFTVFTDSIHGVQVMPADTFQAIGTSYCGPAVQNSSGAFASIAATGSPVAAENDVLQMCSSMPTFAFGAFIVSQTQGVVMMPGGSSGNLCLGGAIQRDSGAGQIQDTGAGGSISLQIDLT